MRDRRTTPMVVGALRNAKQCQDRAARRRRVGVFPETRRFLVFFGSESQEAAVMEGNLVVGERDGPGCHILPQSDLASWLVVAMRSPEGTRTHSRPGPTAWCRRRRPRVPITRIPWLPGPPATGAGSSKKSLWNQKWGGCSPCKGGGARYLHPADGLCDRWLGAITL